MKYIPPPHSVNLTSTSNDLVNINCICPKNVLSATLAGGAGVQPNWDLTSSPLPQPHAPNTSSHHPHYLFTDLKDCF